MKLIQKKFLDIRLLLENDIIFFFLTKFFFLLRIFTTIQKKHLKATIRIQLHKSVIKVVVVKTQHTQRKIIIIKKGNTNFPPQGISTPTTPQTKAPTAAVKE